MIFIVETDTERLNSVNNFKGGAIVNIKKMRINRGLSQGQLADLIGVVQQHVSRWENEKHRPSVDVLIKIAAVLNCSIGDLI